MIDPKKKKAFVAADNPIEQLKDIGAGVVRDAAEVPTAIFDTALEQFGLKPQKQPLSGEIQLSTGVHKTNENVDRKDASIDAKIRQLQYVQRQEKEVFNVKQKTVEKQIQNLMMELAKEVRGLEKQTAELTSDVKKITVENLPANAGAYHLNFFDWVISTLRDLRKRVGESRMWLNTWTKKKKQKGYWAMYKKHGNNFAMSDERGIATANG